MTQRIHQTQLANGLTLLVEPMPWLESAAFTFSLPAGYQFDPEDRRGLANFCCEMVQRGCGDRDSRQFVEDLEFLGVDYSASVSSSHTTYSSALPAESLPGTLEIFADMVRRPSIPVEQLEDGRRVCFHELLSIEDDLQQRAMIELRRRIYPDPLGRISTGDSESIAATTLEDIQDFFQNSYRPNGAILGIAGKVDWEEVKALVTRLFGDWEMGEEPSISLKPAIEEDFHITHDSNQTQIALAYPAVPYADPDYFLARGAVGVLSDGMSSRLFTEIREKRGLCYTVYASYHSFRDRAAVICYAGSRTERAQETLDVLVEELHRIGEGIRQDELDRLKVQMRSTLVMQQESSRSRASSMVGDWWHLGRARTLDELNEILHGLSVERINSYLAKNPPQDFRLVTLGNSPLEKPRGISHPSA